MFDLPTDTINIDGVVEIPQCGLYVKTPEAMVSLKAKLNEMGYSIKETDGDKSDRNKLHGL